MTRYFVHTQWSGWLEVTKAKFVMAERDAGFRAPGGGPGLATTGFRQGYITGVILEPGAPLPQGMPAQAALEELIGPRAETMDDADIWRGLGMGDAG